MKSAVKELALRQYVQGGANPLPIVSGYQDTGEQVRADMFAAIATSATDVRVDVYESKARELESLDASLTSQGKEIERKTAQLQKLQSEAPPMGEM